MTRKREVSSYQDTVTGHKEDQDRAQECENLYVTIQKAAQYCGVSSGKCPETSTDFALKPAHVPRMLNIRDPFSENVAKVGGSR
jgi:hypothetical protein